MVIASAGVVPSSTVNRVDGPMIGRASGVGRYTHGPRTFHASAWVVTIVPAVAFVVLLTSVTPP